LGDFFFFLFLFFFFLFLFFFFFTFGLVSIDFEEEKSAQTWGKKATEERKNINEALVKRKKGK